MSSFSWAQRLLVVGIVAVAAGLTAAEEKEAKGFKPLFNGKDLSGWKTYLVGKDADPDKTWTIEDGVIKCTGKPNGYFYTDKPYKNYVVRYDWKYIKPEAGQKSSFNSGLLIHIQPPNKIWPKCVEAQGANKNHGTLFFLGGAKNLDSHYDQSAKDKAAHPVGEWNTTEVTCGADGTIAVKINGTPVASGKSDLTEGPLGLQSEGAEIHFRKILIKEME